MGLTPEEEQEYLALLEAEAKKREIDKEFQPQPGPQEMFLNTTADLALFGGAAGAGKTRALLIECARHTDNSRFGSVVFRRESTQITNEGGLWDAAMDIYPLKGAVPKQNPRLMMTFPAGGKVSFSHLQYEKDVLNWMGSEVPLICFDELTHFTRYQFFYMLSRNRSTCGVKPYMRMTCNPDPDCWVADFISWWINQDTGFPIPERSGVIRYFTVVEDAVIWGDSPEEVAEKTGIEPKLAKSFTFISASIYDNPALLEKDPGYIANLNAMGTVEKGRLLHGNWKIKPSSGMYFRREQAQVVKAVPGKMLRACRAWDLAASIPTPKNPSPDATAGPLMGVLEDGRYIIMDLVHGRWQAADVRTKVHSTAVADKVKYGNPVNRLPQDPGQAGKDQKDSYAKLLSGFVVKIERMSGDKVTRAEPFSSQWQLGNVLVLEAPWNDTLFTELEAFPEGSHDDIVDACSDAFSELQNAYELYVVAPAVVGGESYWRGA